MAKVVDITDKLSFDGNPSLTIKGKTIEVNADAPTMLKVMNLMDGEPGVKEIMDVFELMFSGTARKPETVRPGCYWSICLYLGLMGVGYLLIEPLGFYAATFLCIVAMTAYGTFWLSGRKADLRGLGSVLAYSLLLIAVEYGCFSLILEVQTPTGLLF